ncbi:hypothetical protein GYA27_02255 [candidate division WWE3 bacterium]|uniref:Uncharacterized protein n=1 Tax=candidate division WWE3 bacterium TaxID=2053526 RepID=A0A7X9DKS2_UNCKA|nr:hypothetical protein [candidate division WWE3 bacterium]
MSKQRREFSERREVPMFGRLLGYCLAGMLLVWYFSESFKNTPDNLRHWTLLANLVTVLFASVGVWGLSTFKGKKTLEIWLLYGFVFLLATIAFVISLRLTVV